MTVGQTATVEVSSFFRDPDGGTLRYTAASSAESVVSVSVSGSNLTLTAVAVGTAAITVTATDPDGLAATQSAVVTVEATNRAPEAVGTISARTMSVGQTETVDVSPFFTDPDGDQLTYTAASSDEAVAAVSLTGSNLTVTAVAAGTAMVTVTATDPDGLTAMQGAEVTVEDAAAGFRFRDDFDSSASLDNWEILGGSASVSDGLLRLTNTDDDDGWMIHSLETSLTAWTLRARMSRAEGRGRVSLSWYTGHERFTVFAFDIKNTSSGNYGLYMWDDEEEGWIKLDDQSGDSNAVNHEAGEMTEITIARDGGELVGMAGDTELFRWRLNKTAAPLFEEVTGIELFYTSSSGGRSGLYDWVEVTGTESGAAIPDRSGARSRPESMRP